MWYNVLKIVWIVEVNVAAAGLYMNFSLWLIRLQIHTKTGVPKPESAPPQIKAAQLERMVSAQLQLLPGVVRLQC